MIRELVFYDGVRDQVFIRHECLYAFNGRDRQVFVYAKLSGNRPEPSEIERVRLRAQYAIGRYIGRKVDEYKRIIARAFTQPQPSWVTQDLQPLLPIVMAGPASRKKTHALAEVA